MTIAAAWVVLGEGLFNLSMEDILRCGFPRTLNTLWYTGFKLKIGGADASQELSAKDIQWDNNIVFTGVFLPHNDPLCLIEGTSVFTISRWTIKELGAKYLE